MSQATFAADNKDQLNMWWEGLQQHLLDQGIYDVKNRHTRLSSEKLDSLFSLSWNKDENLKQSNNMYMSYMGIYCL